MYEIWWDRAGSEQKDNMTRERSFREIELRLFMRTAQGTNMMQNFKDTHTIYSCRGVTSLHKEEEIRDHRRRLHNRKARSDSDKKVQLEDSFSGNPTELENFLTSCVLYMDCYPGTFNCDKPRINFIISHCRHKVMKSLHPLMNRAQQLELLQNSEEFLKYLRRHWGDPDEKGNAKREMRKLRQQGSASEFFLKFNQLVAILGWSPDSEILVENAIDKLAGELKDEIVRQGELEVSSIDQLMDFVVPLDLRERKKEKCELQACNPKISPQHKPQHAKTLSISKRYC